MSRNFKTILISILIFTLIDAGWYTYGLTNKQADWGWGVIVYIYVAPFVFAGFNSLLILVINKNGLFGKFKNSLITFIASLVINFISLFSIARIIGL